MAALQVLLGRMIGFGYDWLAIGTAMTLTYFACLDSLAGCTLGKLVLGLRVVGLKGQRPSLRQSAHREMFMLIGAIPFVGVPLAVVAWVWLSKTIRSNPLGQGKHDMLADGTRVIREGRLANALRVPSPSRDITIPCASRP